jgi:hypothetical protein
MKSITNNSDVQSLIGESVSPEYLYQEQEAEMLAADAADFEGYSEWSADLEEAAWNGAQTINSILIKKACEHTSCPHTQCERGLRLGGIEI